MQTLWLRVLPNKATKTEPEKNKSTSRKDSWDPGGNGKAGPHGKLSQGHMRHGCHGSFLRQFPLLA